MSPGLVFPTFLSPVSGLRVLQERWIGPAWVRTLFPALQRAELLDPQPLQVCQGVLAARSSLSAATPGLEGAGRTHLRMKKLLAKS